MKSFPSKQQSSSKKLLTDIPLTFQEKPKKKSEPNPTSKLHTLYFL